MAVRVPFEKVSEASEVSEVSEDAELVRYAFGVDAGDLARRLTPRKDIRRSAVDDGPAGRADRASHPRPTPAPALHIAGRAP